MKLPKSLTTVTRFSKMVALIMFILFPVAGFLLGIEYQRDRNNPLNIKYNSSIQEKTSNLPFITPFPVFTEDWRTYSSTSMNITFKYPPHWKVNELNNSLVQLTKSQYVDGQNFTNTIVISREVINDVVTLDEWLKKKYKGKNNLFPTILESAQKIILGGEGQRYNGGVEAISIEIPGAAAYHAKATLGIKDSMGYEIKTSGLHYHSGIEEAYQGLIGTFQVTNP